MMGEVQSLLVQEFAHKEGIDVAILITYPP